MAVPTVAVTGKVLLPDGSGSPGGLIVVALSHEGSVEDSGVGTQRVAAVKAVTIQSNGSVSFNLVPNESITPSGTVYRAEYRLPSGATWTEYWSISTSPSTLEIGDIVESSPVSSGPDAGFPSVGALPTPSVLYRGRVFYVPGGSGTEDKAYICLKASDDTYNWIMIAQGG